MIVTFDGPSVSGKSTLAKAIAKKFGFYYLNSGMLYRGLAYCLVHTMHIELDSLRSYHDFLPCFMNMRYDYKLQTGAMTVFLNNEDITAYLKTALIDKAASALGNNKEARIAVMNYEHILVKEYESFSSDGRDCGSVVFPQAEYKFYVTAALEVRAARWQTDQAKQGNNVTLEQAKATIKKRDKNDSEREFAPLIIPQGAIIIDTSDLTKEQATALVCEYIMKKKRKLDASS